MSDNWRALFLGPTGGPALRKAGGEELSFADIDEFFEHTGIDLSGKTRIAYEPDRPNECVHIDEAASKKVWLKNPSTGERDAERVALYEAALDNFDIHKANLTDPMWGLDLDQAKTESKKALKLEGREVFDAKYDWLDMVKYIVDDTADKTQVKADYDSIIAAFITARNAVNACATVVEVKAVTADWPTL